MDPTFAQQLHRTWSAEAAQVQSTATQGRPDPHTLTSRGIGVRRVKVAKRTIVPPANYVG